MKRGSFSCLRLSCRSGYFRGSGDNLRYDDPAGADTCRPDPEDAVGDGNYNRREEKAAETGKTAEKVESAPAVRLVNTLIESAYKRNASDIHIEPGKEFLTIRFRIDGDLCMYTKMEMSYHRPVVTRLKLMGEMDIAEKKTPQDGKYRYEKKRWQQICEFPPFLPFTGKK